MRYLIIFLACFLFVQVQAQNKTYPLPEFINEIYLLKKDSPVLVRLEKNIATMETKLKLAGFGGAEYGYYLDGSRSDNRISSGEGLSFIYYAGGSGDKARTDSILRSQGIDPGMTSPLHDPSAMISLYKVITEKDQRKILLHQGSSMGLGKSEKKAKYTFSVKRIREGYYELVVDKTLPKGEYAFMLMNAGNADGSYTVFAFGID